MWAAADPAISASLASPPMTRRRASRTRCSAPERPRYHHKVHTEPSNHQTRRSTRKLGWQPPLCTLSPVAAHGSLDSVCCSDRVATVARLCAPQLPRGDCGGRPSYQGGCTDQQDPRGCATTCSRWAVSERPPHLQPPLGLADFGPRNTLHSSRLGHCVRRAHPDRLPSVAGWQG
jgi:hypothetical protein